jgi:hypothetical protein
MASFFARRMMGFVAGGVCALALTLSPQAAQAQQSLVGVSFLPSATGNQVYNLNATTNDGTAIGPLVGAPAASPVLIGLGVQVSTNILFTFDTASDRLLSLNGNIVTSVFNIGVGDLSGEGDLAFNPLTGTGFLSTTNGVTSNLFSFSTVTSTSTLITSTISDTLDGLAFNATGTLFAVSTTTSTLYTVNITSGALTAVGGSTGNLGFTVGSGTAGIAFAANGVLIAALDDQLYTVNTLTGAATLINPSSDEPTITAGSLGNGAAPGLSGIAFVSVPEPGAGALAFVAAPFALGIIARRRKR